MEIFKFGGASIKSAGAIKNLHSILRRQSSDLVIVMSAMGKTTNLLENMLSKYFVGSNFDAEWLKFYNFHHKIVEQLFEESSDFFQIFDSMIYKFKQKLTTKPSNDFDKEYDAIVSYGEIFSTLIISHFLNENGVPNTWIDARCIIKTDNDFRAAAVNFDATIKEIAKKITFKNCKLYVTQGFIGSTKNNIPTTLGREGSDYTASVLSNALNASKLTLWKDVEGIYNIDPKITGNAVLLQKISYREATELAYFGAKIIHHRTTNPLIGKNIPLIVKSFKNTTSTGTMVANFKEKVFPQVPIIIYNPNQMLLTVKSDEFINELMFEKIYSVFNKFKIKINLVQNSALNLSVCFNYSPNNCEMLLFELKQKFQLKYNKNLLLITIRHYNKKAIDFYIKDKKVILEQKNRLNAFYLTKN